jgi:hypothetical protein
MHTIQQHQRTYEEHNFNGALETATNNDLLSQRIISIDLSNTLIEVNQNVRRYERIMTNKCLWSFQGRLHIREWRRDN